MRLYPISQMKVNEPHFYFTVTIATSIMRIIHTLKRVGNGTNSLQKCDIYLAYKRMFFFLLSVEGI